MGYRFATLPATNKELGVMPDPALTGDSQNAAGVTGFSKSNFGVRGDSDLVGVGGSSGNVGVVGTGGSIGVSGYSPNGPGVQGITENDAGVSGFGKNGDGVYGIALKTGSGVVGVAGDLAGTGGAFTNVKWAGRITDRIAYGLAATFSGHIDVVGNIHATGSKSFKIDHPLDPANKYLYHYSIESDSRKNIYDGEVKLDSSGSAIVELPEWFEAVNTNFRYQLTPIGAACPNLHVSKTVRKNRFEIAGGNKGIRVSWQITASRNDAWARANPAPVVEQKPRGEKGRYFFPHLYEESRSKPLKKTLNTRLLRQIERGVPEPPAVLLKPVSSRPPQKRKSK
jgi:hypothetical protein